MLEVTESKHWQALKRREIQVFMLLTNGKTVYKIQFYSELLGMQINVCYAQYALYCTCFTQFTIAEHLENNS